MKSIKRVYKIGNGPSSSHTVGPYNAALYFRNRNQDADRFQVILYGSLAFTGEGHGSKRAILTAMKNAEVIFDTQTKDLYHPNTMLFRAYKEDELLDEKMIYSVGGGSFKVEGEDPYEEREVYLEENFTQISTLCKEKGISLTDYIYERDDPDLYTYLEKIWKAMKMEIERGLESEGLLPGGLNISRKAGYLYRKRCYNESSDITMNRLITSYAYAASEENACENIVVTAPTCGSCGVIPALFYYMEKDRGYPEAEIIDALAVAGLIGNVIIRNASISGAECGCQAEIGSACSMAAAGLAFLEGLNIDEIEYAAEVAMEHNLGLTCDPINGLVQIPCIERNAVAAMRAMSSVNISRFLYETRKISFDEIVATMYQTGKDMDEKYRETSHGGLAAIYKSRSE